MRAALSSTIYAAPFPNAFIIPRCRRLAFSPLSLRPFLSLSPFLSSLPLTRELLSPLAFASTRLGPRFESLLPNSPATPSPFRDTARHEPLHTRHTLSLGVCGVRVLLLPHVPFLLSTLPSRFVSLFLFFLQLDPPSLFRRRRTAPFGPPRNSPLYFITPVWEQVLRQSAASAIR